jgi:Fe-Mn family superoxide dismutase
MAIELPPLPYPKNALEPYISTKALSFHYDKHHHAFVDNLKKVNHGIDCEYKDFETLIATSQGDVYNNAVQIGTIRSIGTR